MMEEMVNVYKLVTATNDTNYNNIKMQLTKPYCEDVKYLGSSEDWKWTTYAH